MKTPEEWMEKLANDPGFHNDHGEIRAEDIRSIQQDALDDLKVAAQGMIGIEPEMNVLLCNCCDVELDEDGKGHRNDCLAALILSQTPRTDHENPPPTPPGRTICET